jgi:hypothetical protein
MCIEWYEKLVDLAVAVGARDVCDIPERVEYMRHKLRLESDVHPHHRLGPPEMSLETLCEESFYADE